MTRVRAPLRLRSINLVSVLQLTQKSSLPSLRKIGVSLCVCQHAYSYYSHLLLTAQQQRLL